MGLEFSKFQLSFEAKNCQFDKTPMERVSVISSDLFDLDDYIKSYLLSQPDMSFATAVKIILRYYITPELIVQLSEFENYLKTVNYSLFMEVFGEILNKRKPKYF